MKFWLAFGENPSFSRKDKTMFYVVPADGNKEIKLWHEAFVEAADVKSVKDALVAEIDRWCEHEAHMDKISSIASAKANKNISPDDQSRLTIAGHFDRPSPKRGADAKTPRH